MKHPVLAALALSLLAAPAFAEHDGKAHRGPDKFFEKVDTDKDGKISRAEFAAKGDEMFKEADTNNDGFITKEEGKAAHEMRRAKWQAKRAEMQKARAAKAE